ncbi:hypothetical protein AgCh_028271 [Apium graveolens]
MSGEYIQSVYAEQQLQLKRMQVDLWNKELNRHKTPTEGDMLKLNKENKKTGDEALNYVVQIAQNTLNLAKSELDDNEKIRIENEKIRMENEKIRMENRDLKEKIQVMKQKENEVGEAQHSKMKGLQEELEEKDEKIDDLEALNMTLLVKERLSNDELQESRKESIEGFERMFKGPRSNIVIRKMGEIDVEPFKKACQQRFSAPDEAVIKALELQSLWQDNMKNTEWHPFKIVPVQGNSQYKEVINPTDQVLENLKKEWGDDIYEAVCKAFLEMNEYNRSGRYVVRELWNRKEDRKATMKEVVSYIMNQLRTQRRKRKRSSV